MSSWTLERVKQLETLAKEGLSASQIAIKLGGVTRNAVIGKLYRAGFWLKFDRPKRKAAGGPRPRLTRPFRAAPLMDRIAEARELAADGVPALHLLQTGGQRRKPTRGELAGYARAQERAKASPPNAEPKSLLNLAGQDCRWPVTDGPPHLFCAAPKSQHGGSYCPFHAKMAMRPVPVSQPAHALILEVA